jgi:hypothetical protein
MRKLWIPSIIIALIIIGAFSSNHARNQTKHQPESNITAVTTKVPSPTTDPKIAVYKAKVREIISQLEAEDAIIDKDYPKRQNNYNFGGDPTYIHAAQVYNDLKGDMLTPSYSALVPKTYKDYDNFLYQILTTMSAILDSMTHPQDYGHPISWAGISGIVTVEQDLKLAKEINPKSNDNPSDTFSYETDIRELVNIMNSR